MKRTPLQRRTPLKARQSLQGATARRTPPREPSEAHSATQAPQRAFHCPTCDQDFERPEWVVRRYGKPDHCSRACAGEARQREGSTGYRGRGWLERAAAARARDDYRCVRCGADQQGETFPVDHVIPWVMLRGHEEIANHPDNLATLCPACHGTKTSHTEPRLLKGDMMALQEFYGPERTATARALLNRTAR